MRKTCNIFQSGIILSKLNMMVSSCICFPGKDIILFLFLCMCVYVCVFVYACVCVFLCMHVFM